MKIKLNGEWHEVTETQIGGYPMVEIGKMEFYVFESAEDAGKQAREYWENMAQDDPSEFACIVGEKTLIQWGLGQYAGPGWPQVKSLEEWLDLWLDTPEEQWGSYDGAETEVEDCDEELEDEIGFKPTVAYRHN